jgi:hypothetical protein
MTGNFTVLSAEQEERLKKLEAFYQEIRKQAVCSNLNNVYAIYEALSAVDSKWNLHAKF